MIMWPFSKKEEVKPKKRSFDAAKNTRLVQSWAAISRSINVDLKEGVDAVRARARDLAQNEPMVKKYLSLVAANVVGSTGIVLQCKITDPSGKPDKLANDAIEQGWYKWSEAKNCDVSGRMSMPDFERALIKCIARDGEAIIYEHVGANNDFGYALQLLDINRLATVKNQIRTATQNAIIMGVEIDGYGKPVNYHMYEFMFGDDQSKWTTKPYSAENIIHLFLQDSPEQIRGVSWMHASMIRMFHLKKYQEWAIIAAGVGASKMGFFTSPEGDGTDVADGEDADTGELYQEASGGQFGVLPEGWGFESFNPDYPHAMYAEFIKAAKRDIAGGLNTSYHSLANDLEGVNFSSIRSGTLEEREEWKVIQNWFINAFLERIYPQWLRNSLLNSAIKSVTNAPMPASKLDKFKAHNFLGRRWPWVDPLKDIQASVEAINNGLTDPHEVAAQLGTDIEDVLDGLAAYQQMIKDKGVEINALRDKMPVQQTFNDAPEKE